MRARTFNNVIEELSCNFGEQNEMTVKVSNSLKQTTRAAGDLRGDCFHFLSAIS